ncbi:MAG: C4-dicarboxylate ABC transporter substrate-binding protein, partial [Acidimicrobiaceae bacterium]|nr:C4-dicarboxylate ABC transporter substrate-binding protein [Acidimicrobiaceae bacterium]
MKQRSLRRRLIALGAVAIVGLAACGGSDDAADEATDDTTDEAAETVSG